MSEKDFRQQVYDNIIKAKEGIYIVAKLFSADYHLQGIEYIKEMIRFGIAFDNGFDLSFNDSMEKLKKTNSQFPPKVKTTSKTK